MMLRGTAACLIFFVLAVIFAVLIIPAAGQTLTATPPQVLPRIISPIDDLSRVKIPDSTHPMARAAYDAGHLDGATALQRMILVLGVSPEQDYRLRTLLDSQQSKGSQDYHHWLTPEEFGQKFGPSPQDIAQVQDWLKQHGFTISSVAKSGRWIEFSGTAAGVEEAFQTPMRQYSLAGEPHVANERDISIPAALAPVVQGVLSLHNFHSKPTIRRSPRNTPVTLKGRQNAATDGSGDHFITPGDLATIYSLTPLYKGTAPSPATTPITGAGETIAIVAGANINTKETTGVDDVGNFRALFGLGPNPPNIILNGPDPGLIAGLSEEATLDVNILERWRPMQPLTWWLVAEPLRPILLPLHLLSSLTKIWRRS
jgi:subtilase family serine protease